MADIEEHAIKRDKKFLVRLILLLVLGIAGSLWIYTKLTSKELGSCAARSFGAVTDESALDGGAGTEP